MTLLWEKLLLAQWVRIGTVGFERGKPVQFGVGLREAGRFVPAGSVLNPKARRRGWMLENWKPLLVNTL